MKLRRRLERYLSAYLTLGRTKGQAKEAHRAMHALGARIERLEASAGKLETSVGEMKTHIGDLASAAARLEDWTRRHEALADDLTAMHRREAEILARVARSDGALLARMFTDISRRLDGAEPPSLTAEAPDAPGREHEGFGLFLDAFHHRLRNRRRVASEKTNRRLRLYLSDIEAARARAGALPVMDIGCGRGEWLGLMREAGIEAFGVDADAAQVEAACRDGLDVRQGDAPDALAEMPDASLAAVTAHHIAEHLPFEAIAWIVREAMRALAPGGVLLLETIGARAVPVGAMTVHTDPTRREPMTAEILATLFETAGYDPIDIRHVNPHARLTEFLDKPDVNEEMALYLFGAQDLAVLGIRPAEA